jgi:hypothetical protein
MGAGIDPRRRNKDQIGSGLTEPARRGPPISHAACCAIIAAPPRPWSRLRLVRGETCARANAVLLSGNARRTQRREARAAPVFPSFSRSPRASLQKRPQEMKRLP